MPPTGPTRRVDSFGRSAEPQDVKRPDPVRSPHWEVHGYADARTVLTHPLLSRTPWHGEGCDPLTRHVLNLSGSEHGRVRKALDEALERRVPAVAACVRPFTAQLLSHLEPTVDVAGALVRPLVLSLLDAMFGLTTGTEVGLDWWHDAAAAVDCEAGSPSNSAIWKHVAELVGSRQRAPRDDLISYMARDPRLSSEDAVATTFFAVSAGYVNTVNFLTLAILAAAQHPDQYAWLRANPASVSGAVEELLRFCDPPTRALLRLVTTETDVAENTLTPGTRIYIYRASANRDPRQFSDPDRLDLSREQLIGSLAFGSGPHYCPAAGLTRLIADLALLEIADRVSKFAMTPDTSPDWDFARPLWLRMERTTDSRKDAS